MQVGEIYKNAIATEVSKGSALEMSATSRLQPHQDDTEKAAFQHMLQRHVDLRLLTRAPTMAPLAPKKWLRQNKVHAIDMDAHASARHGAPPLSPQVHAIDMDAHASAHDGAPPLSPQVHAIDMDAHASAHDGAPPLSPQVHAIDMDGDGKVSAAELKAAKAATKAGMEVMAKILPHELPALYDDFTSEVRARFHTPLPYSPSRPHLPSPAPDPHLPLPPSPTPLPPPPSPPPPSPSPLPQHPCPPPPSPPPPSPSPLP
jgi:hypothetical protein